MTLSRANPSGWGLFEILTSGQMNTIDSQLPFAVDGVGGGNYAPTATIELNGNALAAPTMRLLSGLGNAALVITANTAGTTGGIDITVNEVVVGITVNGLPQDDAGVMPAAIVATGSDNATSTGGRGISVTAGDGGTVGSGGDAVFALGGAATQAAESSGAGVYGEGGIPAGGENREQGFAAGVVGVGGSNPGSINAGHGVVGLGGTSGLSFSNGAGGYFEAFNDGIGVIGVAGPDIFAAGVQGVGGTFGVQGDGLIGGSFTGSEFGVSGDGFGAFGIGGVFGSDFGVTAIQCGGRIDFDGAFTTDKNPLTTEAVLNKLYAKNCIKAWGLVTNGTLTEGFNIDSVVINPVDITLLDVTFAQPMANTNYIILTCPVRGLASTNPRWQSFNITATGAGFEVPTTSTFQVHQIGNSASVPFAPVSQGTGRFHFAVLGEQ